MYCDSAGHEQEWFDETSSDLKNMLIMCQHSNTVPNFNVKCSAHGWLKTNSLICKQFRLLAKNQILHRSDCGTEDAVRQC